MLTNQLAQRQGTFPVAPGAHQEVLGSVSSLLPRGLYQARADGGWGGHVLIIGDIARHLATHVLMSATSAANPA